MTAQPAKQQPRSRGCVGMHVTAPEPDSGVLMIDMTITSAEQAKETVDGLRALAERISKRWLETGDDRA